MSHRAGKTSVKAHDDSGSDDASHTPVQSPAAQDDSYAATFESDSRVGSAVGSAADNGTIASICPNDKWDSVCSVDCE